MDGVVFDLGRAMTETCRPLLMAIGEDFALGKQTKEERGENRKAFLLLRERLVQGVTTLTDRLTDL